MTKNKIVDCITFFDENYIFDLRYNIIKDHVDFIVICEALYDHRGNKKNLNFNYKKYSQDKKVKYLVLKESFPKDNSPWNNQALQREFLLNNLHFANDEDYIFFSDPDEIPNTDLYDNFSLKKKYGIFLQKSFNYKFNLFNKYESPWDGTRVSKKKNLKSIDYLRQKVWAKNLKYKFYRIDKEKNIELFLNGGWHFNNIMTAEKISKKLKTFAHTEYSDDEFSSIDTIRKKIENRKDLFNRGYEYEKVKLDESFPKYLLDNKEIYKDYIL